MTGVSGSRELGDSLWTWLVGYSYFVMPRFEFTFDLSKQDFVAATDAWMRASPQWIEACAKRRRSILRQTLWFTPFLVAFGAFAAGRDESSTTMYLIGAFIGLGLAAVMYVGLSRVDLSAGAHSREIKELEKRDLGKLLGATTVTLDDAGFVLRSPGWRVESPWDALHVAMVGGFLVIQIADGPAFFVPPRAFTGSHDADNVLSQTQAWAKAARLSPTS